jgi:nicotinamidase-related amidase
VPERAIDNLPADLIERLARARGSAHAFTTLDSRATALVVIDMTQLFVATPGDEQIVTTVNQAATLLRRHGGTVLWIRPAPFMHDDLMQALMGTATAAFHRQAQQQDDPRNQLVDALDVHPQDLHARKALYSAFFPGASDAAEQLRARHIDTVLIAGLITDVCVEASARDAASCGFRVILLADACRGSSPEAHTQTLRSIHRNFGDVRATAEVEALIAAAPMTAQAG